MILSAAKGGLGQVENEKFQRELDIQFKEYIRMCFALSDKAPPEARRCKTTGRLTYRDEEALNMLKHLRNSAAIAITLINAKGKDNGFN